MAKEKIIIGSARGGKTASGPTPEQVESAREVTWGDVQWPDESGASTGGEYPDKGDGWICGLVGMTEAAGMTELMWGESLPRPDVIQEVPNGQRTP